MFREVAVNTLIFGILQVVLSTVLGFLAALLASGKKNRIQWLNSYQLTLYVLVLISVWKTVGFNFLFFLSGIQTISEELWEAFSMDSKSAVKWVWHIVIPLISPTAFAAILLCLVYYWRNEKKE